MSLIKEELLPLGFKLESPVELSERGSHLTLSHAASWRICQCLLQGKNNGLKIIPDFRPDKYIRLGIAPLYIGFNDLLLTVERLKEIILEKESDYKICVVRNGGLLCMRKKPRKSNFLGIGDVQFTLQRGYGQYTIEGEDDENALGDLTHVVFVIHGVGEAMWSKEDVT